VHAWASRLVSLSVECVAGWQSKITDAPARPGVKAAQKRGVKFGRKPKLFPAQIEHAREQIDKRKRRGDVAALLDVDRTTLCLASITSTLYRALAVSSTI
jgi:hypothetical protein